MADAAEALRALDTAFRLATAVATSVGSAEARAASSEVTAASTAVAAVWMAVTASSSAVIRRSSFLLRERWGNTLHSTLDHHALERHVDPFRDAQVGVLRLTLPPGSQVCEHDREKCIDPVE